MTDETPRTAAHGHWESPLSVEAVFQGSEQLSCARAGASGVFFLLSQPDEGNAQALMHLSHEGELRRITPPGVNVRSRVHEYGGLPYAFDDEAVYYCNFADQRLMRQAFLPERGQVGEAVALSPAPADESRQLRYADLCVDTRHGRLIAVREDHRNAGAEPLNALVSVDLRRGGEGTILYAGSDFVASPRLAPDGSMLAFQTWSHPHMPWDSTELRVARFDANGALGEVATIGADRPGSLVQPLFHPNGDLYFIADWSGWWNLYRLPAKGAWQGATPEAVLPFPAECCPPQWQLGQRHFAFLDARHLLLGLHRECFWELGVLDLETRHLHTLQPGLSTLEDVCCAGGTAAWLAATPEESATLWSCAIADMNGARPRHAPRVGARLPRASISLPRHLSYPTGDGDTAHALYYAPRNPGWRAPARSLPPLVVCVHGGPTSSARSAYNPILQFWTTRGFAVLDVNHRGSTGYGRAFRRALYGRWGEADIADVVAAVEHVVAEGLAAPDRVVIRGGSAGGYVVLAALASSTLFRAGSSYYGISDLETLARDTHKFESRYLDQLIGPWPETAALYRERSPLYNLERIRAPVLLLQGMQDKVVPPDQAEEIHLRLQRGNGRSRLIRFENEGHGFRRPENQVAALQAELDFYREVLG